MSDTSKYLACMESIKLRLGLVNDVVNKKLMPGIEERFAYEFVSLNLRKILELIAFSSLIANKDVYAKAHEKYTLHWKADKMLDALENLHPNFYPRPIELDSTNSEGVMHFRDVTDEFLTKEDFRGLYDTCSEVIHEWNPYTEKDRIINFGHPVLHWIRKIHTLLRIHYVRMIGKQELWIVYMDYPLDGRVHIMAAAPKIE